MNAIALALLYLTGGSPHDLDGPDHEAGCYLGDFGGGESRLVYDGPASAPFYVGAPGSLVRHGVTTVAPGGHVRGDVTVHAARAFEVTVSCDVPDLNAGDPSTTTVLTLAAGEVFVFLASDCDGDGICVAQRSDGTEFPLIDGTCEVREVSPLAPAGQLGWWVPAVRGGVDGWVRGDAGFHVESRCFGPDDGAPSELLSWHRI